MGGAGKRVGVIGLMVETTTNVLAALKLQNQEVRLQQMFDQTPSFMALLNGPEHRFIIANPAYRKLVGHRDILGQTVAEALPEIAGDDYLAMLDQVHTSGVASRLSGAAYDVQDVPQGKPTRRYIDMLYQPITDASGAVTGIFVDGTDVTDVVSAQDAIRASDAQFRSFSEVMPNHVWTARPNGHLDWLNARVSEYSGRLEDQLLGVGWTEIVHPADWPDAAGRCSASGSCGVVAEPPGFLPPRQWP